MKLKHSKRFKIHQFKVGEYASLRIPRIDRVSTDLQRLPCVIVEVVGKAQAMYRLCCKCGMLHTCFHAGDLKPFEATYRIPVDGWKEQPMVTLREAACQQSPWNSFTKNHCNCKAGTCDTRRCNCKKASIEYSSHCHKGEGCTNKPCGKKNRKQENSTLSTAKPEVQDVTNKDRTGEISCTCRTRCHSQNHCPCKAAETTCTALCHPQRTCVNIPMPQTAAIDLTVETEQLTSVEQKKILQSKERWLDDTLIIAAQSLLKEQYPHIGRLQSPILGVKLAMEPQAGEFVQILSVQNNHWICMSTVGCRPSSINVYDSLHGHLNTHTRKLIADLMQSEQNCIEVCYADVQWQSGVNDCGLFSIAFATSICSGEDPTTTTFQQNNMRSHLLGCIELKILTNFPIRSIHRRPKPACKENISIYCVCRLIDDGTRMVECSSCQKWFHLSCVQVPEHFLGNKELDWKCSSCVIVNTYTHSCCDCSFQKTTCLIM